MARWLAALGLATLVLLVAFAPAAAGQPHGRLSIKPSPTEVRVSPGARVNISVAVSGDLQCEPPPPLGSPYAAPKPIDVVFYEGRSNEFHWTNGSGYAWRFEDDEARPVYWIEDTAAQNAYRIRETLVYRLHSEYAPPAGVKGNITWTIVLTGTNPGSCSADGYTTDDPYGTTAIEVVPSTVSVNDPGDGWSGTSSASGPWTVWILVLALLVLALVVLRRRRA